MGLTSRQRNSAEIQVLPETAIGASHGDAFLAGLAVGILRRSNLDGRGKTRSLIEPDAEHSQVYRLLCEGYLATWNFITTLNRSSIA